MAALPRLDAPEAEAGLGEGALQTLFALSVRYYQHQMYPQSARVLEYLLRHQPAVPHYHRALGKALQAQGLYEQALPAYARAIRLGLPDADVHFYVGQCLLCLRQPAMAQQALERCLLQAQAQPQRWAALIDKAQWLAQRARALASRADSPARPQPQPASRPSTESVR